MQQQELENILESGASFDQSVKDFVGSCDIIELSNVSSTLFMMDLLGATDLIARNHAKIHAFRQAIQNVMDSGAASHEQLFSGLAGFNVKTSLDDDMVIFMVKHLADKMGNTYRASVTSNLILKSIFTGMDNAARKRIEQEDAWGLTKSIAIAIHYKLNPSANPGKLKFFEDKLDKKTREKIMGFFARNYTEKIIAIYATAIEIPGVNAKVFSDYVNYKIGIETNLMEFRAAPRREFKKLDDKIGLKVESTIKLMYSEAVGELKLSSLSAKTNLWHMVSEFVINTITMQDVSSSIPSVITSSKVAFMAPAIEEHEIISTLHGRLSKAVNEIKKAFPDKGMEHKLDFVKQCYSEVIGVGGNPSAFKELNIKFGIPLQKLFISTFKQAEKSLSPSVTRSLPFIADGIFNEIEANVVSLSFDGWDYSFEDLYYDLDKGYGQQIDTLITEMKSEPGADTETLIKIFDYYTKNAANRAIVEYKDIPPKGALDRKFNQQINFLLKSMYEFSTTAINTTVFEVRFSAWNQIERVIKTRIIKHNPTDKMQSIKLNFDRKEKGNYLVTCELLSDSILTKLGAGTPISLMINEAQQALLLYFQQGLRVMLDRKNTLSPSLFNTARGYFDDFDNTLSNFINEIRASGFSAADLNTLHTYVYDLGRDYIHNYLAKHQT